MSTLTVYALIERYIAESLSPGMRPLGESHARALRLLQRQPIAALVGAELRKQDVIEHCRTRRATALPATVQQDVTYLAGVLKYAASAWVDCEGVSDAAIAAAKPFLVKHQLIGKSAPRSRVPTDEEAERLLAYFALPERAARMKLPMLDLIAFARLSTRRRGEVCRMRWEDIDWDRKDAAGSPAPMYLVRDVKHPKLKEGNHKWFPMFPELAEIVRRQPRSSDGRVFPFDPDSITAAWCRAKAELGIEDLHWHDLRRESITGWLAKLHDPHLVRLISGHATTHILERVYDATDPVSLHSALRNSTQSREGT